MNEVGARSQSVIRQCVQEHWPRYFATAHSLLHEMGRLHPAGPSALLQGKVVVLTGGTGSSGRVVTQTLAHAGARVIVATRNTVRCRSMLAELKRQVPHAQVECRPLALSQIQPILRFVDGLHDVPHVDYLIHNAQIAPTASRALTWAQRTEAMAIHVSAPVHLSYQLFAARKFSPEKGAHILFTTCDAHRIAPPLVTSDKYDIISFTSKGHHSSHAPWHATPLQIYEEYSRSRLAAVLAAKCVDTFVSPHNIRSCAVLSGFRDVHVQQFFQSSPTDFNENHILKCLIKTPEQRAASLVWRTLAPLLPPSHPLSDSWDVPYIEHCHGAHTIQYEAKNSQTRRDYHQLMQDATEAWDQLTSIDSQHVLDLGAARKILAPLMEALKGAPAALSDTTMLQKMVYSCKAQSYVWSMRERFKGARTKRQRSEHATQLSSEVKVPLLKNSAE